MGQSTNGCICFGIKCEESAEFPWDVHDDGIDGWWLRDVCGYSPPFQMFDDHGEWIGGEKAWPVEKRNEYWDHHNEFSKAHPLPIELENYCSSECPMYIIAVKDSVSTAWRGEPVEIDAETIKVPDKDIQTLRDFAKNYLDMTDTEPKWYLYSYLG